MTLTERERAQARAIVARGCALLLRDPASVHYTQGPERWQGIDQQLRINRGECITQGDCSSTATWILWNALANQFGVGDVVNGERWRAGYTGTIAQHGRPVRHDRNIRLGDLVLYGRGWPYEHVAVSLGGSMVFSHGSEGGPYKLPIDYRPDRAIVRRFI